MADDVQDAGERYLSSVVERTVILAVFAANIRRHVTLARYFVAQDTVICVVREAAHVTTGLVQV